MKSISQHQFSQIPQVELQRSTFNRSHGVKTTFDAGYLIPVFVDEALPGDTFNVKMSAFARLATPLKPIMDNLYLDSFFFAVPYRLVWDNWVKFMGEQIDPGDSTDYVLPTITTAGGFTQGSLSDYFGLPTLVANTTCHSLFHRAYQLIWNTWFRDQNLVDSQTVPKDDGPDFASEFPLQKRMKRHDYFTSCLPWPQKGDAVTINLADSAPVIPNTASPDMKFKFTTGANANNPVELSSGGGAGDEVLWTDNGSYGATTEAIWHTTGLLADLSNSEGTTINALREAFQLQRILERDARGGSRYYEIIKNHFSVTDPGHAVLQRPEYLGGGTSPVNFHPVPQTSEEGTTPQGNLAAMATAAVSGHGFVKSFTEHCMVIGLVSSRADLTYQQGMNRMFSRSTRFDFYWPTLAHLGEQAVLNKEIFYQDSAANDEVFGYQERFAEYRYKPSVITGKMRSNATGTLDLWHLSQDFDTLPTLSEDFIEENPPIARVIAVPTEPQFLFDGYFDFTAARPMPIYSVPGHIDHF